MPKTATKTFKRRFLETWIDYVESVAQQAEHRSESRILDLESYFLLRRHTSGAPSTIALCEMDMDIPDYIREHPILRLLETLAVDLIVIGNVSGSRCFLCGVNQNRESVDKSRNTESCADILCLFSPGPLVVQ